MVSRISVFWLTVQNHCLWFCACSALQIVKRWQLRRLGPLITTPDEFEKEGFTPVQPSKSYVFEMFSKSRRSQIPSVWRAFSRSSIAWRFSVDGRPIRINKAAFLAALYSFLSNRNEFTKTERDYIICFLAFSILTLGSICVHFYTLSFWLASVIAYIYEIWSTVTFFLPK